MFWMDIMRSSIVELKNQKNAYSDEQEPGSTPTTASTTPESSPESDLVTITIENPLTVNLSETFDEIAVTNSVADRIRPTFEIHLSPEEEITHSIVHHANWSFITPIGLQQYDYELKKITVVLSIEELQNLGFRNFIEEAKALRFDEEANLTYDELIEAKKKTNINNRLSIEQWRNLEIALIKSPYGRTVLGYSINEEVYLKFWGHVFQLYYQPVKYLGYSSRDYQYPPRKDDAEKLMLEFFQKDFVKNLGLSAQVAAYSYLSIDYILTIISMQKNISINSTEIYLKYINYFAITTALVFSTNFLFLNSPCINNQFRLNTSSKLFYTLQEFVNNIYRLYNYINFFGFFSAEISNQILLYLSVPTFCLAIYLGTNKKDKTSSNHYINLHKNLNIRFLYNTLNWSSYNQNLLLISSRALLNLSFYFQDDDAKVNNEYNKVNNILFYAYFILCVIPHMMRHPSNEINLRYTSKYLSNILNGLSYSLFDGFAFVEIYTLFSISVFKTNSPTPKDYLDNSLYFTIFSFSFFYSLHSRYSNTHNIPEYSKREILLNKKSCYEKLITFFQPHQNELPTHQIGHNK